jgi:hypothetical protein
MINTYTAFTHKEIKMSEKIHMRRREKGSMADKVLKHRDAGGPVPPAAGFKSGGSVNPSHMLTQGKATGVKDGDNPSRMLTEGKSTHLATGGCAKRAMGGVGKTRKGYPMT